MVESICWSKPAGLLPDRGQRLGERKRVDGHYKVILSLLFLPDPGVLTVFLQNSACNETEEEILGKILAC